MSGIEMLQVSAHAPLQQTCVPVQVVVPHLQTPFSQVDPSPQLVPHLPQLRMSFIRSAQPALGQQVWVMAQGAPEGRQPQWPPMHTVPPVQAALQVPQLLTSIDVGTHLVPQQDPWQFSGWSGQMPPPPPVERSG